MSNQKTITIGLCIPVSVRITAELIDNGEDFDVIRAELSAFQQTISGQTLSEHCSEDDFDEILRLLKEENHD